MSDKCPVNFDTVKNGILIKAKELINDGKTAEEVNTSFGEEIVRLSPDTLSTEQVTDPAVGLESSKYTYDASDDLVNKYLNGFPKERIVKDKKDVPNDQSSIFTSQTGPTQSTKAGILTQQKILTFLSNIGFTNIQKVKELVHNGAPISGDAYIDFIHKTMQIVEGKEDVTLPEEGMHILVELIENSDKPLFRQLEREVVNYQLYYDVLRDPAYAANPLYQINGKPDYGKIKKEAIAKLLAEFLIGNTERNIENQEKVQRVNSWWRAIIDWIKVKFGKFNNPFKDALTRLEQDDTAFGNFDEIYSRDIFLSAKSPLAPLEERDETFKSTKEGYLRLRDGAANSGISKIDDQYYKDGKRWSYSKDELNEMTETQLSSIISEMSIKSKATSKVDMIKDILNKQRGRVSDLVDSYYKQLFHNRPLDANKKEYYEKQAVAGTWIHSIFEDALKIMVDGETGLLKDVTSARNESLASTKTEIDISNKIYGYMQKFLASFPAGTRFLTETIVHDKETNRLGTVDFIAIQPSEEDKNGEVSIYDWKSMVMKTLEGAMDYKKKGIDIQLEAYRDILKYNYNFDTFDKIRAIPVHRIQVEDDKGTFTLKDIELGNLNTSKISERHLRPIIATVESTGNESKDSLIVSLGGIYEKFVNLLKDDNLPNRQVLTELNDTIYELRVSNSLKNLTNYLKDLQAGMDDIIISAEKETDFSIPTLDAYLSDINLRESIYKALDAAKLLREDTTLAAKEREALSNAISRLDIRISKIGRIREMLLDKLAEQEGVYNLLKPERVIGALSRLFRTLGNQDMATSRLAFELTKKAYNKVELSTEDELNKLSDFKYTFDEYLKKTGIDKKTAIGKLVNYNNGTLHSKIAKGFFDKRQEVFDSRDGKQILKFIKDNYDMTAYEAWYKEKLAEQEVFWKGQTYSEDKEEDTLIKKRKKVIFQENYSITKHPLTAFGRHNPLVWGRNIKEENWISKEYEELQKPENSELMKIYQYFLDKNKQLVDIGAIKEWQQFTFLPNIRKTFADIMTFDDGNIVGKGKNSVVNSYKNWLKSLTVGDYELNYQGKRDEITGEKIGKRYVAYVGHIDPTEKSYDIFSIYGLMIKQIEREKQLQDNDAILNGLLAVEKSKQTFESNKYGTISKRGGKLQLSLEKGKNAELLEQYIRAIVSGELLQVDSDGVISFRMREKWNNSPMGKLWQFDVSPETYEPTKISTMKTLMWFNNLNQKKVLGLNLPSGVSNLWGASFAASKLYKKYFTEGDLRLAQTQMVSGAFYASEDMKKRAALVDYFLPLLDNRTNFKTTQLSVNNSSRILSQEWLMAPQRKGDEIVQLNIFLAYLENLGLVDGKLVNLREMAANETGYTGRFADGDNVRDLSSQKEIETKFKERLKELKSQYKIMDKATFKEVERNGKKEMVIDLPGIDRMGNEVETLRSIIHTVSKDATGNMDEFDIAPYRFNIYWKLFMTFKNWIPRQVDVRFGEFHKSQSHNAYEYGRFRMFFRAIGSNWLVTAAKLFPIPYGTHAVTKNLGREHYINKAIEIYKEKKREYQALGLYDERDFISQDDFIDMYIQGVNNTFIEFRTLSFMVLLLMYGIMKPDDDDEQEEKNIKLLMRRQMERMSNEISFFYSPKSLYDVASQGPPILGLFHDMYNMTTNVGKQWFGVGLEQIGAEDLGEKWQKDAHPLKYTFKVLPVLKEVLTYIPTFDNQMAKDWDITLSNK